jgi:hypothetical protein
MKRIEHGPDVTVFSKPGLDGIPATNLVSDVELAAIVGKLEEVR